MKKGDIDSTTVYIIITLICFILVSVYFATVLLT